MMKYFPIGSRKRDVAYFFSGMLILMAMASPAGAGSVTVPAGTELHVKLIDSLSTESDGSGESFRAVLEGDLRIGGVVVAEAGSPVRGRLVAVQKPKRFRRKAKMSVELTSIEIGGTSYEISTSVTEFKARRDGSVIADTTMGAYAGSLAGATAGATFSNDQEKVKKLAAIGAMGGAIFANKKKHIEFSPGQSFGFLLAEALPDIPGKAEKPAEETSIAQLNLKFISARSSEFVIIYPVRKYPFWSALVIHGALIWLVIAYVRSRAPQSQTAPQTQAFPGSFWVIFCGLSLIVILLLAILLSDDSSFLSWKWFAGGVFNLVVAVIANLITDKFDLSVKRKRVEEPRQEDPPALSPLPDAEEQDPGSPPPPPLPEREEVPGPISADPEGPPDSTPPASPGDGRDWVH